MDCDAFRDDMLDVLYGEGGEAAARRVEAHQAACAGLPPEMADLRRLRGDLASGGSPSGSRARRAAAARPRRLPARPGRGGRRAPRRSAAGLGAGRRRAALRRRPAFSVRVGRAPDDARARRRWSSATARRSRALRAELAAVRGRPTSGSSCARWRT